ncbi:MAG: bifunctional homocysteine S-methyltransferase/methylenetetrahydrofolate reductase [Desulfuromonadales bacterium]|nr:bifunctional homocysteine S-methyltransferase/methylenetetrahydrofolate reductase [Desulfuromonadales bacterium]
MTPAERRQLLLQRLQHGPVIVGDGGMGTLLHHRGAPPDAVFEYLNLIDPTLVGQVHADYVAAGAELLETNTFGANALRLATYGLEQKVAAINRAGVRLARAAAGPGRFIAGSVGPLLPPRGSEVELDAVTRRSILSEQMGVLADAGVDCFLLETFPGVADLQLALEVARGLGIPAIAQLAFMEGGFTSDGLNVEQAAQQLALAEPAAIGANCGAGPRELLQVLRRLAAATDRPLSAFPNSGFPERVDGRILYLATPDYFAALGLEMADAGASLVGGCCGTGPAHVQALAAALQGRRPGSRAKLTTVVSPSPQPKPVMTAERRFLDPWGSRPVIAVELDVPRGLDIAATMERARVLAKTGIDAVTLAENPLARIRMSNLALAARLQEELGIAAIAHVTGRDRNLLGLHSALMGAHLLGIRNVLAVTGDPVAVGSESGASNVFDLNSIGLLRLIDALNHGRNLYGAELGDTTRFLAGCAFNPNVADLSGQLHKLEKKLAAGARFVLTQPIFDPRALERMVVATRPFGVPVLMGLMPLVSERNAEFLHNEVPGIMLPDKVRQRMRGASGATGVRQGMAICRELLNEGKQQGVGGYYLIPPFGRVELAQELIAAIRG